APATFPSASARIFAWAPRSRAWKRKSASPPCCGAYPILCWPTSRCNGATASCSAASARFRFAAPAAVSRRFLFPRRLAAQRRFAPRLLPGRGAVGRKLVLELDLRFRLRPMLVGSSVGVAFALPNLVGALADAL